MILVQDFHFGLRQLRKNPGYSAVIILTLALGIGASTAIYSVVNSVILNPVPGPDSDRLLQIGERSHGNKDEPRFGGVTTRTIEILKEKQDFFSDVVWFSSLSLERKTADFIEGISGSAVSPNFFEQWKIKPILGRLFVPGDAVPLADDGKPAVDGVMVLSYSVWKSQFASDPAIAGKTIDAGGRRFRIIGVMPSHFQFPQGQYQKFWTPVQNPPSRDDLGNNQMFVRLKPGVTAEQTQSMLNVVAQHLVKEFPAVYDSSWRRRGEGFALLCRPLRHAFTQTPYGAADLQRTLWGLLMAIGFVLLIVCVNVANLMLARTEKRQQELAVRAAMGAGRSRLLQQLLTESLLLAGLGAICGLIVTFGGVKALTIMIPDNIPRLRPMQIDGAALSAALFLAVGTALAFGLVPAWHASRFSVSDSLKQSGAGTTISAGWRRYRGGLVMAEVALSVVLLTGAGLMIATVHRLLKADPGFDPENLVLAHPGLLRSEKYYVSDRSIQVHQSLYEELQQRLVVVPGVTAVAIGKINFFQMGFRIEGHEKPIGLLRAGTGVGESDVFRAMRIPLLAGRHFQTSDIEKAAGTVIVNETMARLCWPNENALGKKFHDKDGRTYQVVGIVRDAKIGLRNRTVDKIEPTFYRPYQEMAQSGGFGPFLIVRTQNDPNSLIPTARQIIKNVENSMTTPWFQVVSETLYNATAAQRVYMLYLVIFAAAGLLLSALGIYGVLAYSVARRTREIGIRVAIGARPRQVSMMVLRDGVRLVVLGIALGLLGTFWLTRLLRHQLYEVSSTDPIVLSVVVLLLFTVAIAACLLPARRAARIDPLAALRTE